MYSLCFKLYTNYTLNPTLNPTQRAFRTLHWGVQNPTQQAFAKLYTKRNTNHTFCFWTRISRMEFRTRMEIRTRMERMEFRSGWNGWSESFVTFVTNVTYVTNVRNVKQEMAIGGDATRHSCAAPKIQQFWAIFQRFDINIFNLSEHFPPPNFAFSAHNFSLPSPNLN